MKQGTINTILFLAAFCVLIGCGNRLEAKGFAVSPTENNDENKVDGISQDSLTFATKPSNVLLTAFRKISVSDYFL